jgi:hypothetical protein
LRRSAYVEGTETYALAVARVAAVEVEVLTDRINETGREATADDQSKTWDGRRLDSKADVLAFLKEVDAARAEGRQLDR